MGVDHSRADVPVSQKFLDCPDIVPVFKEMCGKGMAQGVRARGLQNARLEPGLFYGPLENRFVEMMPVVLSRDPVGVMARRGEHPLPPPGTTTRCREFGCGRRGRCRRG